ncbi:MAG TPA: hypothetical protein VLT33_50195, partial [Labilithrix sp.]|nr:hypothetical protein [Labilithrix sp.]
RLIAASLRSVAPVVLALAAASFAACGTDVDLGGVPSSSLPDASAPPVEIVGVCEPCATTQSCAPGSGCAILSGTHAFCATLCPGGTECDDDETCAPTPTPGSADPRSVCVPKTGSCLTAKMPTVDGAALEHCGPLEAPTVVAPCTSCDRSAADCQQNGCYGGWWCDTTSRRCRRPPATCP